MQPMKKRRLLKALALSIDVGAPLVATVTQFPVWVERSAGATVSGLFVVLLLLSAIPLFKHFKRFLKSPSAPLMWGILFGFLAALHAIIDEMLIVSLVGLMSNCVGWVLFKLAGKDESTEKETA